MGISNTIPPSRLIQPGVVANTAARPTSPFTGQAIYQVDTNQYLIWNGTAWTPPTNMPWGQVGYVLSSTGGNITLNTTSADIAGASVTFTAVSGRLYKATYNAVMQKVTTNGFIEVFITNASNTVLFDGFTNVLAANYLNYSVSTIIPGLSGSVTIKARGVVDTGTATIFRSSANPTSFIVEDIGPA